MTTLIIICALIALAVLWKLFLAPPKKVTIEKVSVDPFTVAPYVDLHIRLRAGKETTTIKGTAQRSSHGHVVVSTERTLPQPLMEDLWARVTQDMGVETIIDLYTRISALNAELAVANHQLFQHNVYTKGKRNDRTAELLAARDIVKKKADELTEERLKLIQGVN